MRRLILLFLLSLVVPLFAIAEIYETKDAAGNPAFSDVPTPDAEEVELPPANVSDHVERRPENAPAEGAEDSAEHGPTIVVVPNSHNEEVDAAAEEGRRQEVREAETRRQFREAEERQEVREAEERHEVREAEKRREVLEAEKRDEVD